MYMYMYNYNIHIHVYTEVPAPSFFSIISGPNQDALWLELCRDLWCRKVQRYRLTKQRQSELQGSAPGTAAFF